MSFYLNGTLSATQPSQFVSPFASAGALLIGRGMNNINWFPGAIRDVRIFGQALTAAQIAAIVVDPSSGVPPKGYDHHGYDHHGHGEHGHGEHGHGEHGHGNDGHGHHGHHGNEGHGHGGHADHGHGNRPGHENGHGHRHRDGRHDAGREAEAAPSNTERGR
jgi:hypothetical protein